MADATCRILCVDDHQDTSEMLKVLLSQENYNVVTALTFDEALDLVTRHDFDLFVLDKRLPDGSGLELCKRLGEICPNIPCIFYSGDVYDVHRAQAIAAGADAFIAKPDIEALIEAVRSLLAGTECATTAQ